MQLENNFGAPLLGLAKYTYYIVSTVLPLARIKCAFL